jgi:hypothetical protein
LDAWEGWFVLMSAMMLLITAPMSVKAVTVGADGMVHVVTS